ncbi:MAG: phage portal protein [Phycisphaerales bacterium]|nr:phage portal protein [Phycisphaerales bacterium]
MPTIRSILTSARVGLARRVLPLGLGVGVEIGGGGVASYAQGRAGSARDADWNPQGLGPNAMADGLAGFVGGGGLEGLRNRARDLADNNELVDGAAWSKVDAVVRTGLDDFEPDTGFEDLNRQLALVYALACRRVDPDRSISLAESQESAIRELATAGEVGVLRAVSPAWKGFPAMPCLELVEAERIPLELTGTNPANGNTVRQGIEYQEVKLPGGGVFQRIVAYHVLKHHPRDGGWTDGSSPWSGGRSLGLPSFASDDLVRLPAEFFELLFETRRVGQLRGVPPIVSGLKTLRSMDGYVDNTMLLAQLLSSMGVIMDAPNAELFAPKSGASGPPPMAYGADGKPITTVRGLQLMFVKPGTRDPRVVAPNVPGPMFENVMRVMGRLCSRALGRRYDETTGDYSQTTFAGGKLASNDQDRRTERDQTRLLEHHSLPYIRMAADWGVLSGRVKITREHRVGSELVAGLDADPEALYRVSVGLPRTPAINPKQDADAAAADIASGITSEIEQISRRGGSWKRVVRERNKFERFDAEDRAAQGLPPRPAAALRTAPAPAPEEPDPDQGRSGEQGGGNGGAST